MHLEKLFIATRTRNVENAGTSNQPDLAINSSVKDISFTGSHRSRGHAGFAIVDISDLQLLPEEIDYSIVAGGNDLWKLEQAVVWGQRAETSTIVPLGFGSAPGLSTSADEGERNFTPPPVSLGLDTTLIYRLLIVVHTSTLVGFPVPLSPQDSGTNSSVNLQVGTSTGLVVDYDFPATPQGDLERSHANYYVAPVASPFMPRELTNESIILSIRDTDAWAPVVVVIFGIDTVSGNAQRLIPLVHLVPFNFGPMSTDPDEGIDSVRLPLAPVDNPAILPPYDVGLVVVRRLQQRVRELENRLNYFEGERGGAA